MTLPTLPNKGFKIGFRYVSFFSLNTYQTPLATDPTGAAWTPASAANIQMRVVFTTNDLGSAVQTTVNVYEYWAVVRGTG